MRVYTVALPPYPSRNSTDVVALSVRYRNNASIPHNFMPTFLGVFKVSPSFLLRVRKAYTYELGVLVARRAFGLTL